MKPQLKEMDLQYQQLRTVHMYQQFFYYLIELYHFKHNLGVFIT